VEKTRASVVGEKSKADEISVNWETHDHIPDREEVILAATLAWSGLLSSVRCMRLDNIDLDGIPHTKMAKLSSIVKESVRMNKVTGDINPLLATMKCRELQIQNMNLSSSSEIIEDNNVTDRVVIEYVSGNISFIVKGLQCRSLFIGNMPISVNIDSDIILSDRFVIDNIQGSLAPILGHVKSKILWIYNMTLSASETQLVVESCKKRFKKLVLYGGTHRYTGPTPATIDMDTWNQYNGEGVCSKIELNFSSCAPMRDGISEWARKVGWTIYDIENKIIVSNPRRRLSLHGSCSCRSSCNCSSVCLCQFSKK